MTYLLDVNALVALGFANHESHDRVVSWVVAEKSSVLATCSITELGFARVLAQATAYGFTLTQARVLLLRLKREAGSRMAFLPDAHDISYLPNWVKMPKQITDGHLSKLAIVNGGVLATLDSKIPGSHFIPLAR